MNIGPEMKVIWEILTKDVMVCIFDSYEDISSIDSPFDDK